MGKEKSTEELIKELEKRRNEIRAELSKRSKKSANPHTSSFENTMLNFALTESESIGRLLERTEGIKSITRCTYVLAVEVSIILSIAIAIAIKLIVL